MTWKGTAGKLFSHTIFSLIILTVFAVGQTKAAVAVENVTNTGDFTLGGVRAAPLTFSHTVAGVSRVLYVGVSNYSINGLLTNAGSVTSVTYGGQTFERVTTQPSGFAAVASITGRTSVEVFRLKNPTPGTANIVITQPAGGDYVVAGAISLTGVDQTTSATNALASASSPVGGSSTPSVTVATAGTDLVLDFLAAEFAAGIFTPDASQTLLYNGRSFFGNLNDVGASSAEQAAGSTSVTMSWTLQNPAEWSLGAVAVKALAPTAAAVSVSGRIVTASNRGVYRARVALTDSNGETRYAMSNPFGYYRFEHVRAGESYVLNVDSKRYSFAPQALAIGEDMSEVNFTAQQ